MILGYYGMETSREEILSEVTMQEWGTVGPQLGLYLLNHGFEVEIVTMHPKLFNLFSSFAGKEELLQHFHKLAPKMSGDYDPIAMDYFIKFVEAGGTVTPRVPTTQDMEEELAAGRPLISLLTHWFLFDSGLPPRFTGHFNVITGIDETHVSVNDPDWGAPFSGQHQHKISDYLYAIYASAYQSIDNASLIKIRQK